ncbi:hypothetical protein BDK89_3630 [Ilumatobacter fluminis]|uniref:Uncharacterized protein n=1 Tax=Ilumatobacter fluminis TaxID=467091 RepID=A0A4R7I5E9_9ACTN|nr:hypothetical protein [Ilumatobacter fluminis]TDT18016.1 hypothetical protein BDK89_3630 [Ilumatobacter fluminis]
MLGSNGDDRRRRDRPCTDVAVDLGRPGADVTHCPGIGIDSRRHDIDIDIDIGRNRDQHDHDDRNHDDDGAAGPAGVDGVQW